MSVLNWVSRRWLEFRNGHNVYLSFLIGFSNFFLLSYNLLISKIPFLSGLFSNLWVFVLAFGCLYVPVAVLVGRHHNHNQLFIDNDIAGRASPITAESFAKLDQIIADVELIKKKMGVN